MTVHVTFGFVISPCCVTFFTTCVLVPLRISSSTYIHHHYLLIGNMNYTEKSKFIDSSEKVENYQSQSPSDDGIILEDIDGFIDENTYRRASKSKITLLFSAVAVVAIVFGWVSMSAGATSKPAVLRLGSHAPGSRAPGSSKAPGRRKLRKL